jgi:hypothetical protein
VILIDGDEDDGDDIPGFIEGDNFSVIHKSKICIRKILCRYFLREKRKKERMKKRTKDLYGLMQERMNN